MRIDHDYGVPTVAVHTSVFKWVVRSVAGANGMPHMRQVFVPQPVIGKAPAELRAYVEGRNPVTDRPVMQEIVEGLTRPFGEDELAGGEFERMTPRLADTCSEDDLQLLFREKRWTDQLPIVLPTEERVAEAQGDPSQTRRHRRPHATDRLPRILAVHGREGRS